MNDPSLTWDNGVVIDGVERTWGELAEVGPRWPAERVAVVVRAPVDACAGLAAGLRDAIDLLIAAERVISDRERESLRESGYWLVEDGAGRAPARDVPSVAGRLTVLTSGTTGEPKQVQHTLRTLATMSDYKHPPRRWLWPYTPGTYAWYQLAVLALTVPAQSLVPVDADDDWVSAALKAEVDAISATPTFWRRTLLGTTQERLADLRLRQVTIGGEPVDQRLLDRLRLLWPETRLTHIYASTEAGACIAVSDGRAGFPAAWLDGPSERGVRLRLDGDRLFVASPWASPAVGECIDTGDVVRRVGDRVEIVGRADGSVANVGGAKVRLADIERVLDAHPEVLWARASARRAPIVGQLPVADVCLAHGSSVDERALVAWCRERLPEVAVPRVVRLLTDIPTTAALKARA